MENKENLFQDRYIKLHIDSSELDKAIEKANRLKELLREVQSMTSSLSEVSD